MRPEDPSAVVADVVVIGAGIAGASIAAELAASHDVLVLERESQPGYHTTGRSAAIYMESYGNPVVRALTTASRGFFEDPPTGFANGPLWSRRGNLWVADENSLNQLEAIWAAATRFSSSPYRVTTEQALAMVPLLRPESAASAFLEPDAMDLDVDRIHQGYLRMLKTRGGQLLCGADVESISGQDSNGARWQLQLRDGRSVRAKVIVNAAGAWADDVAQAAGVAPAGITPKRRTALIVDGPPGVDISRWPMVVDAAEQYYFKPEAGKLFISPADATPSPPCDAQPDELDVAITVDRLMTATTLQVRRIDHQWAGLRCFASDGSPVVGFAEHEPGFFWFAGQGGYGIQMAPALARLGASLLRCGPVPDDLLALGVRVDDLSPQRVACRTGLFA
jgi:D-arginine dehydrogenase